MGRTIADVLARNGVNVEEETQELTHGQQLAEQALAHYGIKGMRWGVRKKSSGSSGSDSPKSTKYKVEEDGSVTGPVRRNVNTGQEVNLNPRGQIASNDAAAKYAVEALIKARGLDAATNADLRAYNDRLNLERAYSQTLDKRQSSVDKGHKHVKKVLALGKTANEAFLLVNAPAGKALRGVIDANAKAAVGKHRK